MDEPRKLLGIDGVLPPRLSTAALAGVGRRVRRGGRLAARLSAVALCALAGLAATSLSGSALPVAAAGCGGGIPDFANAKPVMVGETPQPINAGSLSEIANAAYLIGQQRFPESFAGVAMDTETDRVTVWRRYSPEFDRQLKALPGHKKIVIRCADHSSRELLAVAEQVLTDFDYWEAQGLPANWFGPRIDGSCVDIHSPDPPRWEAAFSMRYPGAPLCFVEGGPLVRAVPFDWHG